MTNTDAHTLRRIAVEASAHPETIRRILSGKASHSTTMQRVRDALEKLGLLHLLPAAPAEACVTAK